LAAVHPPESCRRDSARGARHTARAPRDLQARLHELRRLGRRVWHFYVAATATPDRERRRLLGARRSGPARRLAAVPILPRSDTRRSIQVRHRQRERDLILLAGERRQGGAVVPELGSDHRIGPGADVQGRRAAAELLSRVRGEAHQTIERAPGAVLIVYVIAAQRQADRRAEVVRDPASQRPPLRVFARVGQQRVGLLFPVVSLHPYRRLAELAPEQPLDAVAVGGVVVRLLRPPEPHDAERGRRVGIDPQPSHQGLPAVLSETWSQPLITRNWASRWLLNFVSTLTPSAVKF